MTEWFHSGMTIEQAIGACPESRDLLEQLCVSRYGEACVARVEDERREFTSEDLVLWGGLRRIEARALMNFLREARLVEDEPGSGGRKWRLTIAAYSSVFDMVQHGTFEDRESITDEEEF